MKKKSQAVIRQPLELRTAILLSELQRNSALISLFVELRDFVSRFVRTRYKIALTCTLCTRVSDEISALPVTASINRAPKDRYISPSGWPEMPKG